MFQLRGDLRFVEKAPPRCRVISPAFLQPLERHLAAQFLINRYVDFAETAPGMEVL
jgi:hypothetical protein